MGSCVVEVKCDDANLSLVSNGNTIIGTHTGCGGKVKYRPIQNYASVFCSECPMNVGVPLHLTRLADIQNYLLPQIDREYVKNNPIKFPDGG